MMKLTEEGLMTMCGSCSGSGKVTCVGCAGTGKKTRLTMTGELETIPCLVCKGSGRVRCNFCNGTGQIGSNRPSASAPRSGQSSNDALEGRWDTKGGWYEFTKDGDSYSFTEHGAVGKTGSGTATISGDTVTMKGTSPFGSYTRRFELDGDTLRGSMQVMGMSVPMVLTRNG